MSQAVLRIFFPLQSPLFENRFVRVMPTPAWSCLSLGRCNWTAWRSLRKRWEDNSKVFSQGSPTSPEVWDGLCHTFVTFCDFVF